MKTKIFHRKKMIISIALLLIIIITLVAITINLRNNKTFFYDVYESKWGDKIFIRKYSYFKEECCMTSAIFYSLKSKKSLDKEIDEYLSNFEYFDNEYTYGYKKDDLFIQTYKVEDCGLYRKIIIVY